MLRMPNAPSLSFDQFELKIVTSVTPALGNANIWFTVCAVCFESRAHTKQTDVQTDADGLCP